MTRTAMQPAYLSVVWLSGVPHHGLDTGARHCLHTLAVCRGQGALFVSQALHHRVPFLPHTQQADRCQPLGRQASLDSISRRCPFPMPRHCLPPGQHHSGGGHSWGAASTPWESWCRCRWDNRGCVLGRHFLQVLCVLLDGGEDLGHLGRLVGLPIEIRAAGTRIQTVFSNTKVEGSHRIRVCHEPPARQNLDHG